MSLAFVSILNPLSPKLAGFKLGRREFLRELVRATLCSLVLPLLTLIGISLSAWLSAEYAKLAVLGLTLASLFLAFPLMFYAGLRLNAAVLARERDLTGRAGPQAWSTFRGPYYVRGTVIPGSVRSRILGTFPSVIGFVPALALWWFILTGNIFMPIFIPPGVLLAVQAVIAMKLLH